MASVVMAAAVAAGGADLGARIGEAAAAERALRGPLEGGWTLRDAAGHALFDLQIADPVDGRLGGAWRDLAAGAAGSIDGGARARDMVHLKLAAAGAERAWLVLRPVAGGRWLGRMIVNGRVSPATLARR
jgi:hypothetical protein